MLEQKVKSNIGRTIKDFYCNGYFGRRYDNEDSIIEAEGIDWIVVRRDDGTADFASFVDNADKQNLLDKWCNDA